MKRKTVYARIKRKHYEIKKKNEEEDSLPKNKHENTIRALKTAIIKRQTGD